MDETDIKRIELLTLDVKPGQVLVVKIYGNPIRQDAQNLRDRLTELFPGVTVLLVSEAVEFTVIDAPVA